MRDRETCLYRHFDAAGNLLYVGVSSDSLRRTRDHNKRAPWMRQIATITIEWFPSTPAALDAEEKAIKAQRPKFNIVHNRGTQLINLRPVFRTAAAMMAYNYGPESSLLREPERIPEPPPPQPDPVPDSGVRLMNGYVSRMLRDKEHGQRYRAELKRLKKLRDTTT